VTAANVVVVLADDLGFSDLGCYGGEIATPNLDRLGRAGVRMSSFYNTARCSPSRASLLTGRHPHETGIGILTGDGRPEGYPGTLSPEVPTMAELLSDMGYRTCLTGKWHLSSDVRRPNDSWPTRRGFAEFYGTLGGAGHYFHPRRLLDGEERVDPPRDDDYYLTDALTTRAVDFVARAIDDAEPFFLYLAYTAPHWPLHAPEGSISPYEQVYGLGWDRLREERHARLRQEGILGSESVLSPRDDREPAWDEVEERTWQARRMAVYAAQVAHLDTGVGRLLDLLHSRDALDDTLILFLSDNGGCAEELPRGDTSQGRARHPSHTLAGQPLQVGNQPGIWPGGPETFSSYGRAWANLSNTPFRMYKRWVHEGGIATPLIAHWPSGGLAAGIRHAPFQLTDLLPAVLAAAAPGGEHGTSRLLDAWRGHEHQEEHVLFWEHMGNAAVRRGRWKAVREADAAWELYDLSVDRSELHDLADQEREIRDGLLARWQEWADRVGVIPWERIRKQRR
jgi:arylsulfatase A-like enzyme